MEICKICNRKFSSKNSLRTHRSRFHAQNTEKTHKHDSDKGDESDESGSSINSNSTYIGQEKPDNLSSPMTEKSSDAEPMESDRPSADSYEDDSDIYHPKKTKLSSVQISKIHDLLQDHFDKVKSIDYIMVWLLQTYAIPNIWKMFKDGEDIKERAGVNAELFVSIAKDMTAEQLTKLKILHDIANTEEFETPVMNITRIWCENKGSIGM